MKERYPNLEVRNRLQTTVTPREGKPPEALASDLGFDVLLFKSPDDSRIVQFRQNAFTFSQLADYTSAEDLLNEAFDLWSRYIDLMKPDHVSRVAFRYINKLALPFADSEPFERYLNAPVMMPDGTPQVVSEFLTRTVLQIKPETQLSAIVTQRLEPGDRVSTPFVLDLDVIRNGMFSTDTASLQTVLQELRTIKNDLFFGLLTDDALTTYR